MAKIVKLEIRDPDIVGMLDYPNGILDTYYLINPDKNTLAVLKHMIENRFDYDGLTDEEIAAKEKFCDNIWEEIDDFIVKNFVTLDIDETYRITY